MSPTLRRLQRGSLTVFMVGAVFAMILAIGLGVDGSRALQGFLRASGEAQEAARTGADVLDVASVYGGSTPTVDPTGGACAAAAAVHRADRRRHGELHAERGRRGSADRERLGPGADDLPWALRCQQLHDDGLGHRRRPSRGHDHGCAATDRGCHHQPGRGGGPPPPHRRGAAHAGAPGGLAASPHAAQLEPDHHDLPDPGDRHGGRAPRPRLRALGALGLPDGGHARRAGRHPARAAGTAPALGGPRPEACRTTGRSCDARHRPDEPARRIHTPGVALRSAHPQDRGGGPVRPPRRTPPRPRSHASLLSSSPAPAADQDVQVQPGDSLWAIAGQEYGNPQEWPAIWGANQGQTEDNGETFTDPSIIDPGWELAVPDPAATRHGRAAGGDAGVRLRGRLGCGAVTARAQRGPGGRGPVGRLPLGHLRPGVRQPAGLDPHLGRGPGPDRGQRADLHRPQPHRPRLEPPGTGARSDRHGPDGTSSAVRTHPGRPAGVRRRPARPRAALSRPLPSAGCAVGRFRRRTGVSPCHRGSPDR